MPPQTKWELQFHGVTVIEYLWNACETMITGRPLSFYSLPLIDLSRLSADMFRFALDNPSLGTTLVLISSSFTLAYTVSILGARRYRVALISPVDSHNNVLLAQASEVIDWRCLLSRRNASHPRPSPSPPAMQNSSATSTPEHPTEMEYQPHAGSTTFLHNIVETLEVRGILFGETSCVKCISSTPSPSAILTSQEAARSNQLRRLPIPTPWNWNSNDPHPWMTVLLHVKSRRRFWSTLLRVQRKGPTLVILMSGTDILTSLSDPLIVRFLS